MELVWIFGKFVLVIAGIGLIVTYRHHLKDKKFTYSKKLVPPLWADRETKQLFKQFNQAWSYKIEKAVNVRIRKANQTLTSPELRECWHELKKFLFLASVSKGLPMFSKKIDDVWHYFLEDNSRYEEFCYRFIGGPIEHHPHEKPKHLPEERAWFDLLYLSFFPITSHSHLWGTFLHEKEEYKKWIKRIVRNPEDIKATYGRHRSSAPTVETLDAFLCFAQEQLEQRDPKLKQRIQRSDGYWYGPAILGVTAYEWSNYHEEEKKRNDGFAGDGGGAGYAEPVDRDIDRDNGWDDSWSEVASDVNTFETGSDGGGSSDSGGWGGSDSGSGCSSCSSCSGCSS